MPFRLRRPRLGQGPQLGPRVTDHRRPVSAALVPERLRVRRGGDRQPGRRTRRRPQACHKQPGRVVQRVDAQQRVRAGQGRRQRRPQGGQRPPAVRDVVRAGRGALPGEQMNARSPARPPSGTYQPGGRVVRGWGGRACLPAPPPRQAEGVHPTPAQGRLGRVQVRGVHVGDHVVQIAPAMSISRAVWPSGRSSTATAPRRLSAAMTAIALGRGFISTPPARPAGHQLPAVPAWPRPQRRRLRHWCTRDRGRAATRRRGRAGPAPATAPGPERRVSGPAAAQPGQPGHLA